MKRLIFSIILAAMAVVLHAQTTKPITLSDKAPFSDALQIKDKTGDIPVDATILFDEDQNTITVTLKSERKLFVFWNDIRYKTAFKHKRLRTDRLSYTLTGNTSDEFRCAKRFRRRLPKPRCKYEFHSWLQADKMQLQEQDLKIVNDSITATFKLQEQATSATLRLRDVLMLDEVKQKGVTRYYSLTFGADFNTQYNITIQRNPCWGEDSRIKSATNALAAIQQSYESFKNLFATGVVSSEDGEKMFHDLQNALLTQFPMDSDSCACPKVEEARKRYNQFNDSIRSITVTMQVPEEEIDRVENAKTIRANARTIDGNVARWLVSTDQLERSDLIEQCKTIITDTNKLIIANGTKTPEERDAVNTFRKAEQYFRRTCR